MEMGLFHEQNAISLLHCFISTKKYTYINEDKLPWQFTAWQDIQISSTEGLLYDLTR